MYLISVLKKKINKIKNRFDVQKVSIIMKKEFETIAYLNKI